MNDTLLNIKDCTMKKDYVTTPEDYKEYMKLDAAPYYTSVAMFISHELYNKEDCLAKLQEHYKNVAREVYLRMVDVYGENIPEGKAMLFFQEIRLGVGEDPTETFLRKE